MAVRRIVSSEQAGTRGGRKGRGRGSRIGDMGDVDGGGLNVGRCDLGGFRTDGGRAFDEVVEA